MSLTPNEAADALRDIETAGRRSGEAFGYRTSAPYFILWGVVWIVGYSASDFLPRYAGFIWLGLIAAAAVASAFTRRKGAATRGGWRNLALVGIVASFITLTYTIMWPVSPNQQTAFVPLLLAAVYSGMGLWLGVRYIVAGVAVAVLTLTGFYEIHTHYNLWMAAVGGGGLVLAGLWLRTA